MILSGVMVEEDRRSWVLFLKCRRRGLWVPRQEAVPTRRHHDARHRRWHGGGAHEAGVPNNRGPLPAAGPELRQRDDAATRGCDDHGGASSFADELDDLRVHDVLHEGGQILRAIEPQVGHPEAFDPKACQDVSAGRIMIIGVVEDRHELIALPLQVFVEVGVLLHPGPGCYHCDNLGVGRVALPGTIRRSSYPSQRHLSRGRRRRCALRF
mmetsp:Transcript_65082/g.190412  ORF Transcript_65082/g.190412 Transcript_65082/m.190412 type:complete len:211 (+) Transcript_65082:313-945(+)